MSQDKARDRQPGALWTGFCILQASAEEAHKVQKTDFLKAGVLFVEEIHVGIQYSVLKGLPDRIATECLEICFSICDCQNYWRLFLSELLGPQVYVSNF